MNDMTCPPADFYVQPAFCSNNPPTEWHPPLSVPADMLVTTGSTGMPVELVIVAAVLVSIGALLVSIGAMRND